MKIRVGANDEKPLLSIRKIDVKALAFDGFNVNGQKKADSGRFRSPASRMLRVTTPAQRVPINIADNSGAAVTTQQHRQSM